METVDRWLQSVLWDSKLPGSEESGKFEIHRSKGRFVFKEGNVKMLQGVREVFEIMDGTVDQDLPSDGKIILIGRNLAGVDFARSFKQFVK